VRSVLYRFPDLQQFERSVCDAGEAELELGLPSGEVVADGEWVLAVFELGSGRRATSAAARASVSPDGARLTFELRDWRRLARFAETEATRPGSIHDIGGALAAAGQQADAVLAVTAASSAAPRGRATSRPGPLPARGVGARVLLVDDDPDLRDVVSAMLEAVELVVSTASSAEEALERARSAPYDLVVLDWNLPKMTGIELCQALRSEPGLSELPVLFLTANASSQDMVHAFASGADDYVVKPFRAPELGARIFSLLRRTRRGT
jgi:two-component system, OmpR family, phosphate regulon response regulator PhoB